MENNIPAIKYSDVTYIYSSTGFRRKNPSIRELSFEVEAGEVFGLIGHNGAGKTTSIKCLLHFLHPKQGKIEIFGINACKKESRIPVGFLPELPYFYDYLRVDELFKLLAALNNIPKKQQPEVILQSLETVKFKKPIKTYLHELSKGQLQRLALAQAILNKPKLLILDEPFSGLDPVGRNDFIEILHNLKEEGTTIFISTHLLKDVENLCDRVAILKDGTLAGVYQLDQISRLLDNKFVLALKADDLAVKIANTFQAEINQRGNLVILKFSDEKEAKNALSEALSAGAEIKEFSRENGGLEELFFKLLNN